MSWLLRALLIVFALALLFKGLRFLGAIATSALGGGSRREVQCRRCNGTGWIAAGEGMKRACECGASSIDAKGPVIDLRAEDRNRDE